MDEKLIDEKLKLIYLTIEKNHQEVLITQNNILGQTTKTNGRVSDLEKETAFTRFITKNPRMIVISFLTALLIANLKDVGPFIKILVNFL